MMLAQGLAEYGAVSGLAAVFQRAIYTVEGHLSDRDTQVVLGVLAVALLFVLLRRR